MIGKAGDSGYGSLPLRERGLKCIELVTHSLGSDVAPFAGAWIEISTCLLGFWVPKSLPLRERGLKSHSP